MTKNKLDNLNVTKKKRYFKNIEDTKLYFYLLNLIFNNDSINAV